jgi:5'(3')-deoxyribonucleotidase
MDRRFLLDCDGVLANFVSAALNEINLIRYANGTIRSNADVLRADAVLHWDMSRLLHADDAQLFKDIIASAGFCESLHAYPGAADAVKQLVATFDVRVVTAFMSNSKTWCYERTQWLQRFMNIDADRVVFARHKHVVAGDFFIDDSPQHVERWMAHNPEGVGIIWTRPYNVRENVPSAVRVSTWAEVFELVAENT